MNELIKVYVKINEKNEIISVASSIFCDGADMICIDEGHGDRYAHAQSQYFEKGLMDEQGRYNYILADGKVVEATEKPEVVVETQVTVEERVAALEEAILEMVLGGMM